MLKIYKATSPSKRHLINIIYNFIFNKSILKTKLKTKINKCGRNNTGKLTIFSRCSSKNKNRYRILTKNFYKGIVFSIEYDPNRNSFLACVFNINNKLFYYVIAANNLKVGDIINNDLKLGHFLKLKDVPIGCPLFNILFLYTKSAGAYSVIKYKTKNCISIILSSGKIKIIKKINSYCIIGIVSNKLYFLKQLGKAGKNKWLGFKPIVRGIAMNSVDHPNGGGKGKKSSKRKNPWGKILKSKN